MSVSVGWLMAVGWLLAGCSTLSSINPASWWHRQEGGKIAEERPAPPGADQPYPNMSTVPAKPVPADAEALKKLTASLVADRTNAQHAAQSAPLADPSSPTASPSLFGVGTAPPPPPPSAPADSSAASGSPGSSVASASMPAVTAPPAPATPPSAAPRKAVQAAPLETPQATTPPGETPPSGPTTGATAPSGAPTVVAAGPAPQPDLPAGPPTRPAAAGAPPPEAPATPAPMPAPGAGPSATIVFVLGASNLSEPATDEVKAFATNRGKGTISVIGYGDSTSSDPDAQSAALNLGLARAQSIAEALKAAGVPGNAIRVSAEASGRGASLHLLQ